MELVIFLLEEDRFKVYVELRGLEAFVSEQPPDVVGVLGVAVFCGDIPMSECVEFYFQKPFIHCAKGI